MLGDMTHQPTVQARDIMSKRLVTVRPETDVAEAIRLLLNHKISGMPVVDSDGVYAGVFSEKSCLKVLDKTVDLERSDDSHVPRAKDFMVTRLIRLSPEQDALEAITVLLKSRVSGAPVTELDGTFIGVFSEKTSMSVLINSAYEGIPTSKVRSLVNTDSGRLIREDTSLHDAARIFMDTPYRRLPVVRESRVLGQISRRDVLSSSHILERIIQNQTDSTVSDTSPANDSMLDAHSQLSSTSVAAFTDTKARTIDENLDLLSIAGIFLNSPYRRLPVIRGEEVVGQVSRRDVLTSALRLIDTPQTTDSATLYLSAVRDDDQRPVV